MLKDEFENIKKCFNFQSGLSGKDEYFNSVVLVLLLLIDGKYHFVFQKRAAHITQGGQICFPGGKIDETDNTLEKTALRETTEEMGIPEEKIELLGRLDTIIAPMGTTVDAFIGIAHVTLEDIQINLTEVESIFILPVSHFKEHKPEVYKAQVKVHPSSIDSVTGEEIILLPSEQLGLPDMYKNPWGNFKYSIYVYKTPHGIIWGITARFIYDVIQKINTFA